MDPKLTALGFVPQPLAPDQRQALDDRGYVILANAIDPPWLARLRRAFDAIYEREGDKAGIEVNQVAGVRRLGDLTNKGEVFEGVYQDARLLRIVRHFLGDDATIMSLGDNAINGVITPPRPGPQPDVVSGLHNDGSLSCGDDGRGMPVDIHPEMGLPGVEVILSTLHAGGKFSNDNYQFSGGLHGVGVSVVNALSTLLEVTIKRDGQVHQMRFANGEKASDLEVIDSCGKRNTGTLLRFWPDPLIFDETDFRFQTLVERFQMMAFLNRGLELRVRDQRPTSTVETDDPDGWVAFRLYQEDCWRGAAWWLWSVAGALVTGVGVSSTSP